MQATTLIYFQKTSARRTKDNLCPVKLGVTHNRIQKYYSISKKISNQKWLFLSDDDIKRVTADKPRGKYKDISLEYKRITDEAERVINEIKVFSFNQFEENFFQKSSAWNNLFVAMVDHIKTLKAEERFGYAASFESTIRSVKEFHEGKAFDFNSRRTVDSRYNDYIEGKQLTFYDITTSWLKRFEAHLLKNNKSRQLLVYT